MPKKIVKKSAHSFNKITHESVSSRISQNRKSFVSYNISRLREVIRYLSQKKRELFHDIPFLLHINSPDFPGFIKDPKDSYGIYRFHDSGFWKLALKRPKISEKEIRPYLSNKNCIRGLYLMGSSGTLAQTQYSDFDYWVVIDKTILSNGQLERLNKKLAAIEEWSKEEYSQHVNFFVVETQEIRENKFSAIDEESSGTAQRTLLKEEFYRTFIMIAGQIPYWAVLPVGLDDSEYNDWINQASKASHFNHVSEDYIDLGNLTSVSNRESLGAILWQIYKARNDPIKSLIKASLIAYLHFFQEEQGLVCDEIKMMYSECQMDSSLIDPYAIVFEKAMNFYEGINDKQGPDLAKECIFLRICDHPLTADHDSSSPKRRLLKRYINEWAWDEKKIKHLESYKEWPEHEKVSFETRIFGKLSFLYELIMRSQDKTRPDFDITVSDLKELRARVESCFKKKPGKLPRCSTYLRTKADQSILITCEDDGFGRSIWTVYDRTKGGTKNNENMLFAGPELLRVIGWIAMNGICKGNMASIMFQAGHSPISDNHAKLLINEVYRFFPGQTLDPAHLDSEPLWDRIFVTLKPVSHNRDNTLSSADFLVRNTWGEIYFDPIDLAHTENNLLKCHEIAKTIWYFSQKAPSLELSYHICPIGVGLDNDANKMIEEFINRFKKGIAGTDAVNVNGKENLEPVKPFLDLF